MGKVIAIFSIVNWTVPPPPHRVDLPGVLWLCYRKSSPKWADSWTLLPDWWLLCGAADSALLCYAPALQSAGVAGASSSLFIRPIYPPVFVESQETGTHFGWTEPDIYNETGHSTHCPERREIPLLYCTVYSTYRGHMKEQNCIVNEHPAIHPSRSNYCDVLSYCYIFCRKK